jgi:exo-1,4-beta-D-glucosaminidase
MKMNGPYDYVPPSYWLEDTERGGAFGFATEVCPGPAVPPIESLKKMLPEEKLWPVDDTWLLHTGGQEFHNIDAFTTVLENRYWKPDGVEEYAKLSQLVTYEAQRAMFEAFARNKFRSTGVIQWMLNNAWPSLIWHLYDYYLRPGGGYYGTQRACEPLHVQYSYDDNSIWVVNDHRVPHRGLNVSTRVLDLGLNEVFSDLRTVVVGPSGKTMATTIPDLDDANGVYFVDLRMTDVSGIPVSRNFYWIPSRHDTMDHAKGIWINTPIARYADMGALRDLARAEVDVSVEFGDQSEKSIVTLKNSGNSLAFFVQARLGDDDGNDILPVCWDDNYISLLPGEARELKVWVPGRALLDGNSRVYVDGINVPARQVCLSEKKGKVRWKVG